MSEYYNRIVVYGSLRRNILFQRLLLPVGDWYKECGCVGALVKHGICQQQKTLSSLLGRQKGREVKMSAGGSIPHRNPPSSDLLALHALFFPLSLHFGLLPRRLGVEKSKSKIKNGSSKN